MVDKVTLTRLANLQNEDTAVTAINNNSTAITTAMDNTLSRDGTSPNQMTANLDMNSNHLLNLPAPTSPAEPLRLTDVSLLSGGAPTFSPIPVAGTTGQVLTKNSGSNFDVGWTTPVNPSTVFPVSNTLRDDGKTLYWDNVAATHKYAWASPADRVADLRDFLDMQYGVGGWTYRTAAHNGSDCTTAMNTALAAVRTRYGYGSVRVNGAGIFKFASGIDPTALRGMNIIGENPSSSQMVFDMNTGVAFNFNGSGGFNSGGLKNINVYIEDGYPASTTYGILLQGDATFQPDAMVFENLTFTRLGTTSFWYNGFICDASARTAPQGNRVCNLKNINIFTCRNIGAQFINAVQWSVDNFGVYVGSGVGNDVFIDGGGTTLTNTTQFDFRRFSIAGTLHLNNCQKVYLNGTAAAATANSTAVRCSGFLEGTTLAGTFGSPSSVTVL